MGLLKVQAVHAVRQETTAERRNGLWEKMILEEGPESKHRQRMNFKYVLTPIGSTTQN